VLKKFRKVLFFLAALASSDIFLQKFGDYLHMEGAD
jgi:hypothetical protein